VVKARQYEQAEAAARRAVGLAPDRTSVNSTLGQALLLQQRIEEALPEFEKESLDWARMTGRALAFAAMGKQDLARAELGAMQEEMGDSASYQYAEINAQLGDSDETFRWLARAREIRDPGLTGYVFVDPFLDPVRSDPRYDALVGELGFTGKN
jgi:tetratricopeptide (TPR) repeat protein